VRWADEIVLVDSGSKDRPATLRGYGARARRALARLRCAETYAVDIAPKIGPLLDADEEISPGPQKFARPSTIPLA
jgi:hypothetical protein